MKKIVITVDEQSGISLDHDMPHHEYLGVLHTLLLHANTQNLKPLVFNLMGEYEQHLQAQQTNEEKKEETEN